MLQYEKYFISHSKNGLYSSVQYKSEISKGTIIALTHSQKQDSTQQSWKTLLPRPEIALHCLPLSSQFTKTLNWNLQCKCLAIGTKQFQ